MRWYSTKEHTAVLKCTCTLLAVQYKKSIIALRLGEWDNGWKDWDLKENIEFDEDHKVIYFCYPDPLPKVWQDLFEG